MRDSVQPVARSVQGTAVYLGIGISTVYKLVDLGKIPARREGRKLLILVSDADAYLASLPSYREVA